MSDEIEYAGFSDRLVADIVDGLLGFLMALVGFLAFDRFNMTYLVGKTGQSWGRGYVKIKVVNYSGEAVGFWRALWRNLFALFISAPPIYLGFLWIIWDPDKQAWHDKVFKTIVIRADTETAA